jgi:hypothetical protein
MGETAPCGATTAPLGHGEEKMAKLSIADMKTVKKQLYRFKKLAGTKKIKPAPLSKDGRYIHVLRDGKEKIGCFVCDIMFEFSSRHYTRKKERVPVKSLTDNDIKEAIEETP